MRFLSRGFESLGGHKSFTEMKKIVFTTLLAIIGLIAAYVAIVKSGLIALAGIIVCTACVVGIIDRHTTWIREY